MKKVKAVVLFSGGLDSILVAKILMEQNIEVYGFNCVLPFYNPMEDLKTSGIATAAKQIDLPIFFKRCGKEYLNMVKSPAHGYGKEMNPCIDCKIFFIKEAFTYMKEINADFIATGEVVGQRPMSQLKHTMNHIFNETDFDGRLLRPLSAKILKPTKVELDGLVDREKLYGLSGRGRKKQIEMAEHFGISNYQSPAGGCLFTDPMIAKRVRDLFNHSGNFTETDVFLLTIGRHYRLSPLTKIIVGRKHEENLILEKFANHADYYIESNFNGPDVFIKGNLTKDDFNLIGSILRRHSKAKLDDTFTIKQKNGLQEKKECGNEIAEDNFLDSIRI